MGLDASSAASLLQSLTLGTVFIVLVGGGLALVAMLRLKRLTKVDISVWQFKISRRGDSEPPNDPDDT